MTIKLEQPESFKDSIESVQRQQNIDALLVIAQLLQLPLEKDIHRRAESKIISLLDKI